MFGEMIKGIIDMLIFLRMSGFCKLKVGFVLWMFFYIRVEESLILNRDIFWLFVLEFGLV